MAKPVATYPQTDWSMNRSTAGSISIIIPTLDEQSGIGELIEHLVACDIDSLAIETIVVDGGSSDRTRESAEAAGARTILAQRRGRAAQMNAGARIARGSILYFLHADTLPPCGFTTRIADAVASGSTSGCFRLAFDHPHWFLRTSTWFTRFDVDIIRFGDQSLFVGREAFKACGGFDESMLLMEDQEIIHRLRRVGAFTLLPEAVTTSARRYLDNGIYRLQALFAMICLGYHCGIPQETLCALYRRQMRGSRHAVSPLE